MRNPQQNDDRYDKTGVIAGPGLLLPEKVKGGGNFYLTAVVEHVQREEEEVENTEKKTGRYRRIKSGNGE